MRVEGRGFGEEGLGRRRTFEPSYKCLKVCLPRPSICEVPTQITHMRDFREPACRPSAYIRGPERAAGHVLQGHSEGRPQGRQAAPSARHAHLQASCYCCERASNCRRVSAASRQDVTRRCEPVRAHSWPSQLQPQPVHEGDRVAHVAVQRGGGRPLLQAENRVVKFAKSGVTAPPTASAMTARLNSNSVQRRQGDTSGP